MLYRILISSTKVERKNAAKRRAWVKREAERREEDGSLARKCEGEGVFRGKGHVVTNL